MIKKALLLVLMCFGIVSFRINSKEIAVSDTPTFLAEQFNAPEITLAQMAEQQDVFGFERLKELKITPNSEVKIEAPLEYTRRTRRKRREGYSFAKAVGEAISDAVGDVLSLHKNLFSWDSFKIISTVFPLFIGARMIDEKLQRCFYDPQCHKNVNQMPRWCHDLAKTSIAVPLVLLGSAAFFSRDDEWRWTGQILLVGMPFVIWTKKLVKQMKFDACLRPWHEKFSCEKRSFGGFPSGHMAQALYMAVLYGSRYGPKLAVPLGLLATLIGVTFLTCNRHFLSQLVGGAGFGTIYALAASKIIDKKLTDRVRLGIAVDDVGRPTFSARVSW